MTFLAWNRTLRTLPPGDADLLACFEKLGPAAGWRALASRASLDASDYQRSVKRLVAAGVLSKEDAALAEACGEMRG